MELEWCIHEKGGKLRERDEGRINWDGERMLHECFVSGGKGEVVVRRESWKRSMNKCPLRKD
jgi:hypothetical protein